MIVHLNNLYQALLVNQELMNGYSYENFMDTIASEYKEELYAYGNNCKDENKKAMAFDIYQNVEDAEGQY